MGHPPLPALSRCSFSSPPDAAGISFSPLAPVTASESPRFLSSRSLAVSSNFTSSLRIPPPPPPFPHREQLLFVRLSTSLSLSPFYLLSAVCVCVCQCHLYPPFNSPLSSCLCVLQTQCAVNFLISFYAVMCPLTFCVFYALSKGNSQRRRHKKPSLKG